MKRGKRKSDKKFDLTGLTNLTGDLYTLATSNRRDYLLNGKKVLTSSIIVKGDSLNNSLLSDILNTFRSILLEFNFDEGIFIIYQYNVNSLKTNTRVFNYDLLKRSINFTEYKGVY